MDLWRRIRQMSVPQLFRFGLLFVTNPFLIAPTLRASRRTISICDRIYGKKLHHGNGRSNAFRHALWNFEICSNSTKWYKNAEKSVIWTEKVTKLYEKVTKNELLDEAMDLHNNRIGRELFLIHFSDKTAKIEQILLKMTKKAVKIGQIKDIEMVSGQMVYISE